MYLPNIEISAEPCKICKQPFLTRKGFSRTVCLKCEKEAAEQVGMPVTEANKHLAGGQA